MTTAAAPRHDWLSLTGGSIGHGLPAAVGAAIACPDRKVLRLQADGSAMYTIQSLWTMAREKLDVTVVLYNNAAYEILKMELQRVGAGEGGEQSAALFDLGNPQLDFTASPAAWACQRPAPPPPRSSPTSSRRRWPPTARASSRP